MRLNSLSFRLILGASLWTAAAIIAAGIVLTSLYERTVQRNFDEGLNGNINTILGELSPQIFADEIDITGPSDSRFSNTWSGWYWQINRDDTAVLTSRSLQGAILASPDPTSPGDANGLVAFSDTGPNGELIRGLSLAVALPGAPAYQILVTGNATALRAEVATFRTNVILTLAIFGLALVISTFIQVRWGLRPLDRIRRGLGDLRSGEQTRLGGVYPAEIEPLVGELNALLESNRQVIERARTQVGNLAHALKTPLAVVTNEARANSGPLAGKVTEQAELMRRQITHYLDRARIAARSDVIGAITEIEPVLARLARAMNRIYEEKGVTVSVDVVDGIRFAGEQQDLEEIVGNLADNACKWAAGRVQIVGAHERVGNDDGLIRLTIDDDGPGLTPEQRQAAMKRGQRLDESQPGSGLGLSIVIDLVGLYGGSFDLGTSPAGGLRAEIRLPAAE